MTHPAASEPDVEMDVDASPKHALVVAAVANGGSAGAASPRSLPASEEKRKRSLSVDDTRDAEAGKKPKLEGDHAASNGIHKDEELSVSAVTSSSSNSADTAEDVVMESETETAAGFHKQLKKGDDVDVFCVRNKVWLPAKIVAVSDTRFRVHFLGWKASSDENLTATSLARIAPRGSEATDAWAAHDAKQAKLRAASAAKKQATIAKLEAKLAGQVPPPSSTEQVQPEPSAFVEAGATRSGRRMTVRVVDPATVLTRKPPTAKPVPKKSKEELAREVQEDNLCGICGEFEDDAMTDMILCDGGCLNSYHFSCLGIDEVPDEEKWLCEQCRTNEQQCFLCGRNGTIGEKGGVFRCSVASCGKFYHQKCIDSNKYFRRLGRGAKHSQQQQQKEVSTPQDHGADDADDADDTDDTPESAFRCPRHVCAVCDNTKKAELMQCQRCPEAYHPHCVPPSARYNNVALLCYRHHEELPRIPQQYLLDRNFDSVVVDFNLRLPVLFLPKHEPQEEEANDCHHFRLQLSFMDQVKKEPPQFRKLVRNIYTFKQPKEVVEDVPMCICKKACDDNCINRLSFTECFGPAPTLGAVPTKAVDRRVQESNCPLGEECGNRALHQRLYPKFQQFYSSEKGWGLNVMEPVKPGQLVIEYVGEVINEEEKDRRLQEHARLHPDDKNMYIMELSNGVYIDARHKGSVSRLINHSCDPNCRLLKWNVRGVDRIAITAIKDIAVGEELTYDYQFHTSQALEWRCFCKSKNCRGTMAPTKLNDQASDDEPEKKLTKKELAKKLKRAQVFEKISQKRDEKETGKRLSLTVPIGRTIARMGPAKRELQWAKHYHVFLVRNAERGFEFLRRRELMDARIKKAMAQKEPEDDGPAKSEAATTGNVETGPVTTETRPAVEKEDSA